MDTTFYQILVLSVFVGVAGTYAERPMGRGVPLRKPVLAVRSAIVGLLTSGFVALAGPFDGFLMRWLILAPVGLWTFAVAVLIPWKRADQVPSTTAGPAPSRWPKSASLPVVVYLWLLMVPPYVYLLYIPREVFSRLLQ
jgi:hypothetical protein